MRKGGEAAEEGAETRRRGSAYYYYSSAQCHLGFLIGYIFFVNKKGTEQNRNPTSGS